MGKIVAGIEKRKATAKILGSHANGLSLDLQVSVTFCGAKFFYKIYE
jgi:hypothetical protein